MAGIVDRFSSSSPSYRRMATSCLVIIVANSRDPSGTAEWLVRRLLGSFSHVVLLLSMSVRSGDKVYMYVLLM